MTAVIINDILPLTQAIAVGSQTVYDTDWTANYASDVVVYSRATGVAANDVTQILSYPSQYTVTFIGDQNIVRVTLVTPSTAGDIVTITRQTPADRLNLYSNTNFTPSMLNQDFGILTLVDQQAQLVNQQIAPRYNYSALPTAITDTILPLLAPLQTWQKNSGGTAIIGFTLGTAAGVNATNPSLPYVASCSGSFTVGHWVAAADTLGTITDGGFIPGTVSLINTGTGLTGGPITTTGTISFAPIAGSSIWANFSGGIAVPAVHPLSAFLLSANNLSDVSSVSASVAHLGLTIGTFTEAWSAVLDEVAAGTYPGASSITTLGTITTGTWHATPITVPYGGTGNTTFTAYSVICAGTTATGAFQPVSGLGTDGMVLTSNGAGLLPTWQFGPVSITPEQIQNQTYVYVVDTGAADAYVVTPSPAIDPYIAGLRLVVNIAHTNTGASTLNVSGLGPVAITTNSGIALIAGQIVAGMLADLEYDGTQFQLMNPADSSSGNVNPGLINQLGYYAANGSVISGLATGNSGTLITSAGGVPSISSTLPSAVQGNITTLGAQAAALNMNTHLINNVTDPVSPQDAATMNYVDQTSLNGTAVYAASITSLGTVTQSGSGPGATLTNAGAQATFALDGENPPAGSNVLIKDTATGMTAANEGIYTVTSVGSGATNWVLTRATSYDTTTEINNTGLIAIRNGTQQGQAWYNTTTIATVDTTSFNFARYGTTGTVTSVATNNGLTGGTITSSGTLGLAAIADHTLLANISGGSLYPSSTTLTALIDNAIGSAQGDLLYRNSTVWTVLAPGTSGYFLQTTGAASNPQWAAGNSGTVTSITAGTGLSGGTITGSGTISLTSPVTVSLGGTGLNAATAYGVLCGGTTSTGAFQSIASVGTSGQVLMSNGASALPTMQTYPYQAINPNFIIGGNFSTNPWQRGTTFSSAATGTYSADRFRIGLVGAGVVDMLRTADAPTSSQAGILTQYCLDWDVTTADASIAATDQYFIGYRMEGYDWAQISYAPFTVSFWVKATVTGIYSFCAQNGGGDRTYVHEFTISASNTWEFKSFTISAAPVAGTWDYTNSTGIRFYWVIAAGSNFTTASLDTWNSDGLYASTNQVNGMSSASNNFRLGLVKVEAGSVYSGWSTRSEAQELALCQRYYEKSYDQGVYANAVTTVGISLWGWATSGIAALAFSVPFKVTKRGTSTVSIYDGAGSGVNTCNRGGSNKVASNGDIGMTAFDWSTSDVTAAVQVYIQWTADAEL